MCLRFLCFLQVDRDKIIEISLAINHNIRFFIEVHAFDIIYAYFNRKQSFP